MAIKDSDRDVILQAKTPIDRDIIIQGITSKSTTSYMILRGGEAKSFSRDGILEGKNFFGRDAILDTKPQNELNILIQAEDPPEIYVRLGFSQDEMDSFSISSAGDPVNEITINYAWDFVSDKARQSITKHNPVSKLLYGVNKETLDLKMLHGTRQAEKIADAVLKTSSIPPVKVSFIHNLRSIRLEVGDLVTITHPAGLGESGYVNATAVITKKNYNGVLINYEARMKALTDFYKSELMTLSQVSTAGKEGITVTYAHGVATITIYADVQGYPPVEGAEITISGVRKVSDKKGQVRFNLVPGTYTATIQASGYEDNEVKFTV